MSLNVYAHRKGINAAGSRCRAVWILFVFVAVSEVSCRLISVSPDYEAHYAVSVPFIAQRDSNDCGPAALAMLIRYHNGKPDIGMLHEALVIPALGGTIPALMIAVATEKGYHAAVSTDNPNAVTSALKEGMPLIVLLGPAESASAGHYVVVTGLTETGHAIRMHNGRKQDHWMNRETFCNRWETTGYTAITMTPSEDIE